jgi:hypothetical protein
MALIVLAVLCELSWRTASPILPHKHINTNRTTYARMPIIMRATPCFCSDCTIQAYFLRACFRACMHTNFDVSASLHLLLVILYLSKPDYRLTVQSNDSSSSSPGPSSLSICAPVCALSLSEWRFAP